MIALSADALRRVAELRAAHAVPAELGLRVRVIVGGCAGFTYDVYFDEPRQGDRVVQAGDQQVLIDPASAASMSGTRIGYDGEGFTMANPQAVVTCSCGASFRTFRT